MLKLHRVTVLYSLHSFKHFRFTISCHVSGRLAKIFATSTSFFRRFLGFSTTTSCSANRFSMKLSEVLWWDASSFSFHSLVLCFRVSIQPSTHILSFSPVVSVWIGLTISYKKAAPKCVWGMGWCHQRVMVVVDSTVLWITAQRFQGVSGFLLGHLWTTITCWLQRYINICLEARALTVAEASFHVACNGSCSMYPNALAFDDISL